MGCAQVAAAEDGLFDDCGATVLWTIQRLPALLELDVSFRGYPDSVIAPISDEHGMPHCKQLAALHSRSLTRLDVKMISGPDDGNALRLIGLPELRSCTLNNSGGLPAHICIDSTSFHGVRKLQALRVRFDEALQLQAGCLQQLTALTALSLNGCGLRTVPDSIAALSATLCVLDLSENDDLQIDAAGAERLLQCGQLQALGMYKEDMSIWIESILMTDGRRDFRQLIDQRGYVPAQFSPESVAQLVRLPSASRTRHGRSLDVHLTLSDYAASACSV